jgi:hypothetical protein
MFSGWEQELDESRSEPLAGFGYGARNASCSKVSVWQEQHAVPGFGFLNGTPY